ncbi:MAG: cobalamin-dependent protein [Candidatus Hydrogenedentes bacterium]|nr:cobalamin-dependent protein [Candidatus Hydrogenedentota bacterium]
MQNAKAASGASGFASVTQQLVDTNKNLQEYTTTVSDAIATAVTAFQDLSAMVGQFEREFSVLRERIDAIRKSTKQISSIAFKSRMVALNASIEAAHIGDAGAGFNVVAQEVRNLSSQTSEISEAVREDLLAVERPLEETTKRLEENQETLVKAKFAIEGLDTTAKSMLDEARALAVVTDDVEGIAFKQVEIQDHLDGVDRHSQWVTQATDALVPELASTSDTLDVLWEQSLPPDRQREVTDLQQFESDIYQAIRGDEPYRAKRAVEEALRVNLDHSALIERVSQAATRNHLDQLGQTLPTETLFRNTRILEDTLTTLDNEAPGPQTSFHIKSGSEHMPVVVLGNAYEDYHDLGRRLVAMRMKAAGFKVIDLGMSVSNDTFLSAATQHNADVIGVSALLLHTAIWIPRLIQSLKDTGLGRVKVIAGGAPFLVDPQLSTEFGVDGVASNPNEAVRLVNALVHQ